MVVCRVSAVEGLAEYDKVAVAAKADLDSRSLRINKVEAALAECMSVTGHPSPQGVLFAETCGICGRRP